MSLPSEPGNCRNLSRREFVRLSAVAGLTAAAWLWQAVPQRDVALGSPGLTRTALVEQARSIARSFDLNTDGWQAVALRPSCLRWYRPVCRFFPVLSRQEAW